MEAEHDAHRQGAAEFVGAVAYVELSGYCHLVAEAEAAPHLDLKLALALSSAEQLARVRRLHDQLVDLDVDPTQAMAPFVGIVDDYHARTRPADWVEGLLKVYVGQGLAADFTRTVSGETPRRATDPAGGTEADSAPAPENAETGAEASARPFSGIGAAVLPALRAALEAEPARQGRMALYARHIAGELLMHVRQVLSARPAMSAILAAQVVGDAEGGDGATLLVDALLSGHAARMRRLGLAA